ncbi:unnamed protein product [Scytosiphon promiscuus]
MQGPCTISTPSPPVSHTFAPLNMCSGAGTAGQRGPSFARQYRNTSAACSRAPEPSGTRRPGRLSLRKGAALKPYLLCFMMPPILSRLRYCVVIRAWMDCIWKMQIRVVGGAICQDDRDDNEICRHRTPFHCF